MTRTNNSGATRTATAPHPVLTALRSHAAYLAYILDPTNGTSWLRMIAAKAELSRSMDAHPAGKGREL